MDAVLRPSRRSLVFCLAVLTAVVAVPAQAFAGQVDLTLFLGRAYPVYDERLLIRPSTPSLPGVDVTVSGDPVIRADGGLVFGGALAFEARSVRYRGTRRRHGGRPGLFRRQIRSARDAAAVHGADWQRHPWRWQFRHPAFLSAVGKRAALYAWSDRHRRVGRSQRAARSHDIRERFRCPSISPASRCSRAPRHGCACERRPASPATGSA